VGLSSSTFSETACFDSATGKYEGGTQHVQENAYGDLYGESRFSDKRAKDKFLVFKMIKKHSDISGCFFYFYINYLYDSFHL